MGRFGFVCISGLFKIGSRFREASSMVKRHDAPSSQAFRNSSNHSVMDPEISALYIGNWEWIVWHRDPVMLAVGRRPGVGGDLA